MLKKPRSGAHKVPELELVRESRRGMVLQIRLKDLLCCHTGCAERNANLLGTADKLFKDTDSWSKNLEDKSLQNQDYHSLFGSLRHEGVSGE